MRSRRALRMRTNQLDLFILKPMRQQVIFTLIKRFIELISQLQHQLSVIVLINELILEGTLLGSG